MIPRDIIELWILFILQIIQSRYTYGFPGRRDSASTYTMDVPGRSGYIYVRIWNGQEITLATALNMGGTPNPNILVRMERRAGILVVVDADPAHALNALGENVAMANVPKHRHFIGSGNEDPVEGRRFVPGLLAPSSAGGLNVHVFPFFTKYGYVAEDSSFTIDDPSTAGTRAWVVVYADSSNVLQYAVSTTHVSGVSGDLDESDIPSEVTLPDGATPVGAVVVAAGGSVTNASQFADYRFHFDHNDLFGGLANIAALTSAAPALDDKTPFADTSNSNLARRTTYQDIFNLINSLTAETAPAVGDKVAVYDASGSATDSMTLEVLLKVIASLTNVTAALDDRLAITDTSDSNNAKYITLTNLFAALTLLSTTTPAPDDTLTLSDASASGVAIKATVLEVVRYANTEFTTTTTGNIDDLDFSNATLIRMNNASDATIRGLLAGSPGQRVTIISVGAGDVFLADEDNNSTAANRLLNFVSSIDTPLAAGIGKAILQYDDTTDRWRLIAHEQGAAIAYTPTWISSHATQPVLGDGTLTGTYMLRGKRLVEAINLTAGSTTTFGGAGFWTFGIFGSLSGASRIGTGFTVEAGVQFLLNMVSFMSATTVRVDGTNGEGVYGPTVPFTWGNGDTLGIGFEYEIA